MEYKQIKKIIEDMEESKLDSLSIEFPDGTKVSMSKSMQNTEPKTVAVPIAAPVAQENKTKNIEKESKEENLKLVKAPMVGTFYNSPAPGKEPFVQVGDKVKKGQVLCIVEAMKLMNEIESEFDGEIVEICVKNEDIVEYGMPLFKIK